ncbi:site-specific integrase [Nitrosomonas sp. Nm34]|uniref:site-specific integrase n=1 Tax=Nitrosomonas sp. Nm34 TaxID=1881055 RepID=UPI0008E8BF3E|nr:site-specific integrase [Nitrosomonas sp. Nm34]SFI74749.1 integrase [Nitrosomonas sp. Nm34]
MGGSKYPGVRESSGSSIEIDFYYKGQRCRERLNLKPSPANLRKAAQHRAAILNAIDAGTFDYAYTFPESSNALKFSPSQYTVKTYLAEWLANKRPTIKASTFNDYRKIIENLVVPQFGPKILTCLSRNDVRTWVSSLDCSNKRIANILSPLRAALQDALHDDLIQSNPLLGWTYQRNEAPVTKAHVDPFTQEEQQAIIEAAIGQIKNQCIVFFWTGMRTSELIALEWSDIDWKRKKIKVNKAFTSASRIDETTKTKTGTREIDILQPVEQALIDQKQYTLLQGNKIFLNPLTGEQWTGDQQIRKSFWIPLLKRANVRYRNPYQTRHTFASMMLSAGENLAWVSQQMGHSNVLITARTYARWIPSNTQQGNKALDMFGQHLVSIKNK